MRISLFAMRVLVPTAASLLLAPLTARAAGAPGDDDGVAPCRPTIACTAELAHPGTVEVEAGGLYRQAGSGSTQRSLPFLIKLTLSHLVQLQVSSNGYTVAQGDAPARFFDNAVLGVKLHITDQSDAWPALALSGAVGIPTPAGQQGYVRAYDAFFTAYASKDLGPVHADLNTALNLFGLDDHPVAQGLLTLALSTNLPPPFGIMAESYVYSNAAPLAPRDGGFLVALSHTPRKWLTFDVGGDIGFYRLTRAYSLFVGMTVVPVVLWR
jgi:hypothetical protein